MNAPEHRYQVNQLTPDPAVKFDREFAAKYVHSPEGRKEFAARSLEPIGSTPEQFAAVMQKDIERYSALAKQLGIQPQ